MLAGTQKPMLGTKLNRAHPLAKGLVGCWLFNEGVGNIAYDSSGYGNHGTLNNMAFPATTVSGWNPSKDGVGLAFDGADDYINCGNDSSLDITDAITIEAWVKEIYSGDAKALICKGESENSEFVNYYGFFRSGILRWYIGNGVVSNSVTSTALIDNQLHHVAFTFNGSQLISYVNGVGGTPTTQTITPLVNNKKLTIGDLTTTANFPFNGSIDGVKIYNRALSAKEIKSLYRKQYAMFERGELLL